MNQKERSLLETIRRSPESSVDELVALLLDMYGHVIRKDVTFHFHIRLIREQDLERVERLIAQDFIKVVREHEELPEGLTVRQLLHLLTVQAALRLRLESRLQKTTSEAMSRRLLNTYLVGTNTYLSASLENSSIVSEWIRAFLSQQLVVVESEQRMTPGFLSSVLVPYVGAIADVQRVCNAVLKLPQREVTIKSISQNSPMSIKLIDAAQAINAIKEDIIPWRRENAQSLAMLKELDVAADIKKKEEEALEIRARATKDEAEAEKIRAEAAKVREEAEQMRIENDKRRFELQKAKFQLALEIISKMQPDLPAADMYVHAMQLLPAIDSLSTSPIEPSSLTS